jgi:hypothetical protein
MVSMRVVKTAILPGRPSIAKVTRAPSDRPIQLRCMVSTLSGHFASPSVLASRSST